MATIFDRRALLAAALLSALVACDHVAPGATAPSGNGGPFSPTTPLQLTLSPGQDLWPSWTPDGSGVWYAFQALDRADKDYCLGLLPAGGGTRTVDLCQRTPTAADDSLDAVASPAARGNRLAWIRLSSPERALVPSGGDLVVAPTADPTAAVSLLHFPFQSATGRFHSFGLDLQWLDDSTLVYAATRMSVIGNPPTDTVLAGQEIALVGLDHLIAIVPNTAGASSVGVGALPGELYFTRDSDTRILRLRLPDSTVSTIYDFGAVGFPTGVRVAGGRILAVVDAVVYLVEDSVATVVSPPLTRWRHPAFSPDGRSFVGSAHPAAGGNDDIYRIALP